MRVAVLLDHLANELGALYPTYRLLEEGFEVDVLTPDGGPVLRGHSGMALDRFLTVHGSIRDASAPQYDAVVCPGGFSADRLRGQPEVQSFVRGCHEAGKVVAHFGHGAWVTLSAGVLTGKRVTAPSQIAQDLTNAGAIVVDQPSVVDHNVVSGNDYGAFCRALVATLRERSGA